jgi:probable O-glycosylation ligase (exosortase A-associated)
MRAIWLLGMMVVLVPLAFFAPFAGLLTFVWLAYVRPHEWAYQPNWQVSLIVACATLLGYFVFELTQRSPKLLSNLLLILLWLQLALSTAFANSVAVAWPKFLEFTKIIVIALLITAMVDSERRMRWLLLVTVVSIGFLSFRANVGILLSRGAAPVAGPGGAFEDNNDFALLLNMALPMMIYGGRGEPKRWLRYGCYALALMTVTTVIFTRSRGGFLGLCAVALVLALKTKYKLTGLMAVLVIGTALLAIAPQDILDRLRTIKTGRATDASASQRIRAWRVSLRIIADYPVLGIGARNILQLYEKYGDPEDTRVSHNAYLQMAVDAGLPALALFLSVIGLCYWRLRKARKILRARAPDSPLINYSHGMEVALIGYLVSATFLSRHDLELLYQVVALAASLILMARSYEKEAEMRELVAAKTQALAPEPVGAR